MIVAWRMTTAHRRGAAPERPGFFSRLWAKAFPIHCPFFPVKKDLERVKGQKSFKPTEDYRAKPPSFSDSGRLRY